jgi:radical SAM protein with 4Fe4S-binding SPASM domain
MLNDSNKHSWCVTPYISLAVTPDGKTHPCCVSTQDYKTSKGNTLADESIINFWNSDSRKNLISQLENGKQPRGCSNCWKEERAGKVSKRMRDNDIWKDHTITDMPATLYLAIGNVCNLKCRICGPDRSSLWIDEESKISFFSKAKVTVLHPANKYKDSFSDDNLFWVDLPHISKEVKQFDFSGGEPMYVKNHWRLLKSLVKNGTSKNQIIHYATNGTVFPEKELDLLNSFKRVQLFISIDGVDRKFEYMRHPANFAEVDSNIDKFLQVKQQNVTDWHLQTTISVSAFNVWDFAETYKYCISKGVPPFINIVHDSHSAGFLPKKLKDAIIEKLMSYNLGGTWPEDRNVVINYLTTTKYNPILWHLFWKECHKRDKFRKESFAKTFPEYFEEIKKYL